MAGRHKHGLGLHWPKYAMAYGDQALNHGQIVELAGSGLDRALVDKGLMVPLLPGAEVAHCSCGYDYAAEEDVTACRQTAIHRSRLAAKKAAAAKTAEAKTKKIETEGTVAPDEGED